MPLRSQRGFTNNQDEPKMPSFSYGEASSGGKVEDDMTGQGKNHVDHLHTPALSTASERLPSYRPESTLQHTAGSPQAVLVGRHEGSQALG